MGYRQLLKDYMRELQLLTGSNFVEELNACSSLDPREFSELQIIAAELNRNPAPLEEEADYKTVAATLFETFDVEPADFLAEILRELATARAELSDSNGHVSLSTLKFITASINRASR